MIELKHSDLMCCNGRGADRLSLFIYRKYDIFYKCSDRLSASVNMINRFHFHFLCDASELLCQKL